MEQEDAHNLSSVAQHERRRQMICAYMRGVNRHRIAQDVGLSYTVVMLLIERECAIKLYVRSVGKYLKRWGFKPQNPSARSGSRHLSQYRSSSRKPALRSSSAPRKKTPRSTGETRLRWSRTSYERYKDSGHDWSGSIPDYWIAAKFRHYFVECGEKIDGEVWGVMLSVSGYRGIEFGDCGVAE